MFFRCLLPLLCLFCQAGQPLTRIAFGSCNKLELPQPMWARIIAGRPQLWVWTGDIIYAETESMVVLAEKYRQQKILPEYRKLLKAVPVIGIWDDHDYGLGDGGADFENKVESQQLLLDFLDEPADSPRRRQLGAYTSYLYGKPPHQIKIILLDTRYFCEHVGPDADVLGVQQWAWLEHELADSKAALHFITSGIQVIPNDHQWEKWGHFPKARERLFRLLGESRAPGIVLISGDRHFAEISRLEGSPTGYPLYEVTASGLTHSYFAMKDEPNRHRVGPFYQYLNFGMMVMDWKKGTLTMQIHGEQGQVAISETVPIGALQPSSRP